jgi:hypothetical protein
MNTPEQSQIQRPEVFIPPILDEREFMTLDLFPNIENRTTFTTLVKDRIHSLTSIINIIDCNIDKIPQDEVNSVLDLREQHSLELARIADNSLYYQTICNEFKREQRAIKNSTLVKQLVRWGLILTAVVATGYFGINEFNRQATERQLAIEAKATADQKKFDYENKIVVIATLGSDKPIKGTLRDKKIYSIKDTDITTALKGFEMEDDLKISVIQQLQKITNFDEKTKALEFIKNHTKKGSEDQYSTIQIVEYLQQQTQTNY